MRPIRTLGLLTVVALAMAAWAATGTATATELCKSEETACAEAKRYPAGTAIEAVSKKVILETTLLSVECKESSIAGKTAEAVGDPLLVTISTLQFTSCATVAEKPTSCTVVASSLPYQAQLESIGASDGELTLGNGGGGEPGATVKCGVIACTASAERPVLKMEGGAPGQIVASKVALTTSGVFCGKTGSLTGTYSIQAPNPVQVAQQGTKICKAALEMGDKCPAGQTYSGEIKGYLPGANVMEIVSTQGPMGTVTCTEAPFKGTFNGNDGRGSMTQFDPKSAGGLCTSSLAGNPAVATSIENLPADRSAFSFRQVAAPQGRMTLWGTKGPKFNLVPAGSGTTCIYTTLTNTWEVTNTGATPMAAEVLLMTGVRAAGLTTICPATVELKGKWWIETVGNENLWLAGR